MIKATSEKVKVMTSDHLNTNKAKILIEDEEWDLLKMFADELLALCEATQLFSSQNQLHHQMYRDCMDF